MKEKRYLCDWWNEKNSDSKLKLKLLLLIVIVLITIPICYMSGLFSIPPYQEEKFDELERLYQSYIHEGVGIDMAGLSKVATVSREAIYIYEDEISFEYSHDGYHVTLHLDSNYNVTSISRNPKNANIYVRQELCNIILIFIIYCAFLFLMCLIIGFVLYSWSCVHKWINTKFHKKHTS